MAPPVAAADDRGADEQARSKPKHLSHEMQSLSGVIKNLEEQLDHMMASNDAYKRDLERERERCLSFERVVGDLRHRLVRSEQDAAGRDNLQAELTHVNHERARLETEGRELRDQLGSLQQERTEQDNLIKRLRAARADALEELQSVEAQFERAMRLVAEVRAQYALEAEERQAIAGRLSVTETRLRQAEDERDFLIQEVEQSRSALDEIRRSLVDACVARSVTGGEPSGPGAA